MFRFRPLMVLACAAFMTSSSVAEAQQPPATPPSPAQCNCSGPMVLKTSSSSEIKIDWCGAIADAGTLLESQKRVPHIRVDERGAPRLRITNFNYLHYSPTIESEGTVVETYVALDKLWKQVFAVVASIPGVSGVQGLDAKCTSLEACLSRWIFEAGGINFALDAALRVSTEVSVPPDKLGELKQLATVITQEESCGVESASLICAVKRLKDAALAAEQFAASSADLKLTDRFNAMRTDQVKLMDRLTAFKQGVAAIETGRSKPIKKYDAGTIVTVSVTPSPQTPAAQPADAAEFEFFVHSKFPVLYHIGYGYSRLADVDFEKVRALNDQDLFDEVRNSESTSAMTAFLSYELKSWSRKDEPFIALLASLGTDFTKPGERIYLGGAFRITKVYLNVGLATANTTEGVGPVIEPVGGAIDGRVLFKSLTDQRDWKPYLGISFSLF